MVEEGQEELLLQLRVQRRRRRIKPCPGRNRTFHCSSSSSSQVGCRCPLLATEPLVCQQQTCINKSWPCSCSSSSSSNNSKASNISSSSKLLPACRKAKLPVGKYRHSSSSRRSPFPIEPSHRVLLQIIMVSKPAIMISPRRCKLSFIHNSNKRQCHSRNKRQCHSSNRLWKISSRACSSSRSIHKRRLRVTCSRHR